MNSRISRKSEMLQSKILKVENNKQIHYYLELLLHGRVGCIVASGGLSYMPSGQL